MARIPLSPTSGDYKLMGSEFVSYFFPCASFEELKGLLDQVEKSSPKADHYAYALRLKEYSKSSDDGEPSGTAGKPMLTLLEGTDVLGAIIVARYFGGTKLGTPRLRRSFLAAAEEALWKAEYGVETLLWRYVYQVSYPLYEELNAYAKRGAFVLKSLDYGINVTIQIECEHIIEPVLESKGIRLEPISKEQVITLKKEEEKQ